MGHVPSCSSSKASTASLVPPGYRGRLKCDQKMTICKSCTPKEMRHECPTR